MDHPASRWAVLATVLLAAPGAAAAAETLEVGGRVTAAGQPLPGAEATLHRHLDPFQAALAALDGEPEPLARAMSDEQGLFRLVAPGPGSYLVRVAAEGMAAMERELPLLVEPRELPAVALAPAVGLEVEVAGPGGRAVASRIAAVPKPPGVMLRFPARELYPWHPAPPRAATAPGGKATLRVAAGVELAVTAVAAGLYPARATVTAGAGGSSLRLEAGAARSREVRAFDAQGRPLPGATLALLAESPEEGSAVVGRSDADGRATVPIAARGSTRVALHGPEGLAGHVELGPPEAGESPEATAVTLEARVLVGRLVGRDSQAPVAGALVLSGASTAMADAAGRYRVPASRDLPGLLVAAAPDHLRVYQAVDAATSDGPTLALVPAASVAGRVVDAEGRAVAGVEVTAEARETPRMGLVLGGLETPFSRSDAAGVFRLAGLGGPATYLLRGRHDRLGTAEAAVESLAAGEARQGVELVIRPGLEAYGRVADGSDGPIAGAEVELRPAPSTEGRRPRFLGPAPAAEPAVLSDAGGRFAVAGLGPGRYELAVRAPGFAPVTVPGLEIAGGATDLGTVVLAPGVRLEGRILDGGGNAVAGARVRALDAGGRDLPAFFLVMMPPDPGAPAATSDAAGAFVLVDLRPGQAVTVVAEAEGYVPRAAPGAVPPLAAPLELVLSRAARLTGRVLDESGRGIAGANVTAVPEGTRHRGFAPALSGEDGRFELTGVEPGPLELSAQAPGFLPGRRGGLVVEGGGELAQLELVLRAAARVAGVVRKADGTPAAGAAVLQQVSGRPFGTVAEADGEGRFVLDGLEPGPVLVEVSLGALRASREIAVELPETRAEIRLGAGVDVTGTVRDPAGVPIAGALVELESRGRWIVSASSTSPAATTEAAGRFRLADVGAGSHSLHARKRGYAASAPVEVEVAELPVEVDLVLRPGAAIVGRILGAELDELAGLELQAFADRSFASGSVDYEGRFRIEGMPPGEARVEARSPGTGRSAAHTVTVPEGVEEVEVDLDLAAGEVFEGVVLLDGEPLANATVMARAAAGREHERAVTDYRGGFRLTSLPAGRASLDVVTLGSLSHREEVELVPGAAVRIEIRTGRVVGSVVEAGNRTPLGGAEIRLVAENERFRSGLQDQRSDDAGRFAVGSVPAGQWEVRAVKEGYAAASVAVELAPGEVRELELELEPAATLEFRVVLATTGRPPTRVFVALLDASGKAALLEQPTARDDGGVRLASAPAGSFTLLVAAEGAGPVAAEVVAPGDAGTLALPPAGELRVVVPALREAPSEASAVLVGPDGRLLRRLVWGRLMSEEPFHGAVAHLSDVPAGTWRLVVTATDGRTWNGEARVTAGETAQAELR